MPHIGHAANVPSNTMILRWRERRREILKSLPPELRREFLKLGIAIKMALDEESRFAKSCREQREPALKSLTEQAAQCFPNRVEIDASNLNRIVRVPKPTAAPLRLPLSIHKDRLIRFLQENGPTLRAEIASATGIPEGSLSQLLNGDEFERQSRGLWGLKGGPDEEEPDGEIPF